MRATLEAAADAATAEYQAAYDAAMAARGKVDEEALRTNAIAKSAPAVAAIRALIEFEAANPQRFATADLTSGRRSLLSVRLARVSQTAPPPLMAMQLTDPFVLAAYDVYDARYDLEIARLDAFDAAAMKANIPPSSSPELQKLEEATRKLRAENRRLEAESRELRLKAIAEMKKASPKDRARYEELIKAVTAAMAQDAASGTEAGKKAKDDGTGGQKRED